MNDERKGGEIRSDTPAERLFRAIGGADPELVDEAADADSFGSEVPVRASPRRTVWRRWAALAACAVIAVGAAWRLGRQMDIGTAGAAIESAAEQEPAAESSAAVAPREAGDAAPSQQESAVEPSATESPASGSVDEKPVELVDGLPKLTLETRSEGMGYEGYMAYDVSELINANPWTEDAELTTLPVYRNLNAYNEYYKVEDPDLERMEALLLDAAERVGLDTDTLELVWPSSKTALEAVRDKLDTIGGDVKKHATVDKVEAEQNGVHIKVSSTLDILITFEPSIDLGEYNLGWYDPEEKVAATAEYLKTRFADLLDMEQPVTNLTGGDYNIHADRGVDIQFYEGAGDLTQQIINYNFNFMDLDAASDSRDGLSSVWQDAPDLSGKVGDYPIITAQEARALLNEGRYITTVPYEMPGDEYVRKVELMYRKADYDEYFIPYYRFYVELPEAEADHDLNTYGAYYVPAVQEKYIANMPLWDGSFN